MCLAVALCALLLLHQFYNLQLEAKYFTSNNMFFFSILLVEFISTNAIQFGLNLPMDELVFLPKFMFRIIKCKLSALVILYTFLNMKYYSFSLQVLEVVYEQPL